MRGGRVVKWVFKVPSRAMICSDPDHLRVCGLSSTSHWGFLSTVNPIVQFDLRHFRCEYLQEQVRTSKRDEEEAGVTVFVRGINWTRRVNIRSQIYPGASHIDALTALPIVELFSLTSCLTHSLISVAYIYFVSHKHGTNSGS